MTHFRDYRSRTHTLHTSWTTADTKTVATRDARAPTGRELSRTPDCSRPQRFLRRRYPIVVAVPRSALRPPPAGHHTWSLILYFHYFEFSLALARARSSNYNKSYPRLRPPRAAAGSTNYRTRKASVNSYYNIIY